MRFRKAGKMSSSESEDDKEPQQGDSHKDDSGSEDARPTTGGKSLSAMGGSSGGGEAAKTGLSDDSDQEEAIQSGEKSAKRKVLDDESEEDDVGNDGEKNSQDAGKTGLSDSDSDDGTPSKKGVGGDGDTEMADMTHRDVFGESDSDDEGAASGDVAKERAEKLSDKHKGQKVLLNKETGQLERGPVEDAPEHAIQDSQVGRDRRAIQKDTLKLSYPALPRPPSNARLYYLKLPKRHLIFDHTPCGSVQEEAAKIAGDTSREGYSESASFVRWRYKGSEKESLGYLERDKETNARFVEWSDGSITLQVGSKHIEVKQQALEKNSHHLYVKHAEAKKVNSKGELEEEVVIQGHGVLEARMLLKPATDDTSRKVLASLSKLYGRKKIDRDSMFVRNTQADNLALQEAARIRNESRKEGARRKAGMTGEMNEDFLEKDIDGNVGGLLARSKRQRRQPNSAALSRAKRKRDSDSDVSSSSSDSSDEAPARSNKKPAPSSSESSSSESSDEGAAPVKKPASAAKKATIASSSSSSSDSD